MENNDKNLTAITNIIINDKHRRIPIKEVINISLSRDFIVKDFLKLILIEEDYTKLEALNNMIKTMENIEKHAKKKDKVADI